MKKIVTPKCSNCGERRFIGNTNGLPNMIGFQQKNGKIINLCRECLISLGQKPEEEMEEFISKLQG